MLNIGTKKYRNLQEQVGYNTECIKKLAEAIDGITIEDKLVVIESDSGTFTDEELVILSGPLAFISDGSKVWMKQSETLVQLAFKAVDIVANEVGGAYFNLGLSQIVINRETGAYNTSADTFFTTYSKTQIDSIVANIMALKANASDVYTKTATDNLLAGKADLTGASFSGAISAPTLLQAEANYKAEFVINPDGGSTYSIEQIYNRFIQINQGLEIVVNLAIKNETENAITVGKIGASLPVLPTSLATQLVDFLGHKVSEAGVAQTIIASAQAVIYKASNAGLGTAQGASYGKIILSNYGTANQCQVYVAADSGVSVPANTTYYLTGRISLTLI